MSVPADSMNFGGSLDFGGGSFTGGGGYDPTLGGTLPSDTTGLPTLSGSDTGLGSAGTFTPSTPTDTSGSSFDWSSLGKSIVGGLGSIGSAVGGAGGVGMLGIVANAYNQMNAPVAEQAQLEKIGGSAAAAGVSMVDRASKGTLTAPQQAALDTYKTQQREQWDQYFAKAGISDSSTKQATYGKIDQDALAMSQNFITQTMTSGLAALGLAGTTYGSIANAMVQRDTALQEAIGNSMNAWATMMGRSGGGGSSGGGSSGIENAIAGGVAAAGAAALFSDRRLKRNIRFIGRLLNGIGVYSFDYIWGQHAVGVMADEVEKIIPEAVSEYKGYKVVNYGML